jgi:hypothetical protein
VVAGGGEGEGEDETRRDGAGEAAGRGSRGKGMRAARRYVLDWHTQTPAHAAQAGRKENGGASLEWAGWTSPAMPGCLASLGVSVCVCGVCTSVSVRCTSNYCLYVCSLACPSLLAIGRRWTRDARRSTLDARRWTLHRLAGPCYQQRARRHATAPSMAVAIFDSTAHDMASPHHTASGAVGSRPAGTTQPHRDARLPKGAGCSSAAAMFAGNARPSRASHRHVVEANSTRRTVQRRRP